MEFPSGGDSIFLTYRCSDETPQALGVSGQQQHTIITQKFQQFPVVYT